MRKLIAGFVAGLLLATANVAGGADWTIARLVQKNESQDYRIWQTRTVVRSEFETVGELRHRIRLLECAGDVGCINGENLAWQMLGSGWQGWPQR